MNSLDSPLEALAFNYLTYGLSTFWRSELRGALSSVKTPDVLSQTKLQESASTSSIETEHSISSLKTVQFSALDRDGSTKGKFTLNYCNEEENEKCGNGYYYDGVMKVDKVGETWNGYEDEKGR
ncbi:hypothetical protein Leryth_010260 [Lithospermum erythrorhizon]|nr:hypothetical protein Leryth_010260 [Lithospermum erythrorhizon]